MQKIRCLPILFLLFGWGFAHAQEAVNVRKKDGGVLSTELEALRKITFSADESTMILHSKDAKVATILLSDLSVVLFEDYKDAGLGEAVVGLVPGNVYVIYNPNYTAYAIYNSRYSTEKVWVAEAASAVALGGHPVAYASYSERLDPTSPGSSWQLVEKEGKTYLYNIGAKKYLATPSASQEGYSVFTEEPKPIHITPLPEGNGFSLRTDTANNMDFMCLCPQYEDPVRHWYDTDLGSCWQFKENPNVSAVDIDAMETRVEAVLRAECGEEKPVVYTLSGVNLGRKDPDELPRGIYVVGGKKLFVK